MNTKNRKIASMRATKERKQKKLVLVLGGLFLVLLVVQGPRTLKMLRGSKSSTPATAPASKPGTPATVTAAAAPVSSTQLPESDVPPRRTRSQLYSFELFRSKDPFAQQISETPAAPVATAAPAAVSSAAVSSPTGSTAVPGASAAPVQQPAASVASSDGGVPTSKTAAAVIDVNGQRQAVDVSQSFPALNPTFRLVSVKGNVATIGIAGGSFASGNGTVTLRAGRTLTLMNTSDGQRYELRLVSSR